MKISTKTSLPVASRRRILAMLPPLGATLLAPRFSHAESCEPRLLVSVADSLLEYRVLLEHAGSEAIANAGRDMARKNQQSRDLWGELKVKLKQLQARLKAASHNASAPLFPEQTGAIEKNVAWIDRGISGHAEVVQARALSLQMVMVSLLQEVSRNCNLDPGNQIQNLVAEILADLDGHNTVSDEAETEQLKWEEQIKRINQTTQDCQAGLVQASQLLTKSLQSSANESGSVSEAKTILDKVSDALKARIAWIENEHNASVHAQMAFQWPYTNVCVTIVDAAGKSLGRAEPAAYLPKSFSHPGGIVPSIEIDRSSLLGRVRNVVRTPNYFNPSPGSDFLAISCVVTFLPVWWNYPGPAEQSTRENLIRSILNLGLIPRVNTGNQGVYGQFVHDLAAACNAQPFGGSSNASSV
jgi:hypothetical protein